MKNKTYTITEAIQECIEAFKGSQDQSQTTIRCALNDIFDNASKSGFKVNFGYDQKRAIRLVKKGLTGCCS